MNEVSLSDLMGDGDIVTEVTVVDKDGKIVRTWHYDGALIPAQLRAFMPHNGGTREVRPTKVYGFHFDNVLDEAERGRMIASKREQFPEKPDWWIMRHLRQGAQVMIASEVQVKSFRV